MLSGGCPAGEPPAAARVRAACHVAARWTMPLNAYAPRHPAERRKRCPVGGQAGRACCEWSSLAAGGAPSWSARRGGLPAQQSAPPGDRVVPCRDGMEQQLCIDRRTASRSCPHRRLRPHRKAGRQRGGGEAPRLLDDNAIALSLKSHWVCLCVFVGAMRPQCSAGLGGGSCSPMRRSSGGAAAAPWRSGCAAPACSALLWRLPIDCRPLRHRRGPQPHPAPTSSQQKHAPPGPPLLPAGPRAYPAPQHGVCGAVAPATGGAAAAGGRGGGSTRLRVQRGGGAPGWALVNRA